MLGIDRDITERKRAEDPSFRPSEERFRQLADNIQEVFWMTEAESGREIYISPAAKLIWERSIDSLMNEPNAFINSLFPEDQPIMLDAIERRKEMGKKLKSNIVSCGQWIPALDLGSRLPDLWMTLGRVKRIAGISADITNAEKLRNGIDQEPGPLPRAF